MRLNPNLPKEYVDQLKKLAFIIIKKKGVEEDISRLRKKFTIDPYTLYNDEQWQKLISKEASIKKDIDKIILKKELSCKVLDEHRWQAVLYNFLLNDSISITEFPSLTYSQQKKEFILRFGQDEFTDDLISQVKKIIKGGKRLRPGINYMRDIDIYLMAEAEKCLDDISPEIDKKYGENSNYGSIKAIKSDLDKDMNIPKNLRKKLHTSKK